jgi:hypothetical protein
MWWMCAGLVADRIGLTREREWTVGLLDDWEDQITKFTAAMA